MKEEKPFFITVAILLVILVGIIVYKNVSIALLKVEVIYDATFNVEELRNVKFETLDSAISIKKSEDKDIRIVLNALNKEVIYAYYNGPDLQFRYMNEEPLEGKEEFIEIYIPKDYKYNLEIQTNNGNIDFHDDLLKASVTVNTTGGDVILSKLKNLTLKNANGKTLVSSVTNKLSAKSISGDIEIGVVSLKEKSNIETNSGNVEIDKTSSVYVKADSTSGNVNVNKNGTKKNITLTIKTNSGNISVN